MKMTFFFFLLIYSRCGAPASWAARHTIVCLDHMFTHALRLCYDVNTKFAQLRLSLIELSRLGGPDAVLGTLHTSVVST